MPFKRRRRPILVSTIRFRLSRRQKCGALMITAALLVFAMTISFQLNLQPVITNMAVASAKNLVTSAVNEAIAEKMEDGSLNYSTLVTLEKDSAGAITALTTDMAMVNSLQVAILQAVIDRVAELNAVGISIPVGNVIGGSLLSGRGPGIPLKLITLTTSKASFFNEFSSAGINQTKHQILLAITVDLTVEAPGGSTTTQVATEVLVAETVIVGDVPNSYLNLQ